MGDDQLFDHYEQELRSLVASATKKSAVALSSLSIPGSDSAGINSRVNIEGAEEDLTDAEGVYRTMALETKTSRGDRRKKNDARLSTAKMELDRLKNDIRHVRRLQNNPGRSDLFDEDEMEGGLAEKAAFVESTEKKLQHGTDRIRESIRVANETESLGANVLEALSGHRQTMLRTRDNLGTIDDDMTRSRGLLSSMARRVLVQRLILYGVGALFGLAFILILFFKLFPRRRES